MVDENEGLEKLDPRSRVKKLRELQEKRKREMEEAENLIKKSEDEARAEDRVMFEQAQQMQERSVHESEDRRLSELLTDEDAEKAKKRAEEDVAGLSYDPSRLKMESFDNLRMMMGNAEDKVEKAFQYGSRQEQEEAVGYMKNIIYGIQEKVDDVEKGEYQAPSSAVKGAIESVAVGERLIRSRYRAG